MDYRTPLQDIHFTLFDLLDAEGHYARIGAGVDKALLDSLFDELAKFTEQELAPTYQSGDAEGCHWEDGVVTTPKGFREAYAAYVAAGWPSLAMPEAFGGQGLPESVAMVRGELLAAANLPWSMYPELSQGAMGALLHHGSPEQQQTYLTPMVSGRWTGTMCLTEPHAGSDVGLARTRAEPQADGSYAITGTKIFISSGEHDMAENIVHLVLARLPDAPPGTKGISLFIVPKFLPDADGNPGTRNAVACGSIEEKMGLHGNATCVLNFDAATGVLVGEPNKGMRAMFTMMNGARLGVGLQGTALAERAFQASLAYALEREQMRSLAGPTAPDRPADPIIVHPNIRNRLLTQKAFLEGGRALGYWCAQLADLEHTDAEAKALLDFMTPICKAFLTETGLESVNHGLQVFGGHGYIREYGMEQLVRDARITLIYEGTTGIQALDLLGRKTLMTGGAPLVTLAGMVQTFLDGEAAAALPEDLRSGLAAAMQEWQALANEAGAAAMGNPEEVGAAAVDFLMYSGYTLLAWFWARAAAVALTRPDDPLCQGKVQTARFYFARLLPRAQGHAAGVRAGLASLACSGESLAHV